MMKYKESFVEEEVSCFGAQLFLRQLDIHPLVRLATKLLLEEIQERLTRSESQDAAGYDDIGLFMDCESGAAGAEEQVTFAENDAPNPVMYHGAEAHGARFQSGKNGNIGKIEAEIAVGLLVFGREFAQADHLRVGGDIGKGVTFIMAAGDDDIVLDGHRADGDFSFTEPFSRLGYGLMHECFVFGHLIPSRLAEPIWDLSFSAGLPAGLLADLSAICVADTKKSSPSCLLWLWGQRYGNLG